MENESKPSSSKEDPNDVKEPQQISAIKSEPKVIDQPRRSLIKERGSVTEKIKASSKTEDEESKHQKSLEEETKLDEHRKSDAERRKFSLKPLEEELKFYERHKSDVERRKSSLAEQESGPEDIKEERRQSIPRRVLSKVLDTFSRSRASSKTDNFPEPQSRKSSLKPIYEDTNTKSAPSLDVSPAEKTMASTRKRSSSAYNPFGSFDRRVSISNPHKDQNRRYSSPPDSRRESVSVKRSPGSSVVTFPEKTRRASSLRSGKPRSVSVFDLTTQDVAICFFPEEPDWGDDDDEDDDDNLSDAYITPFPTRSRSDSIFPDPKTPYDWSQRERWQSRLVYLIALVSYSISFSNIYHFPALVYHYGGIPFLIPYTIFTIVLGYPLHFLESSLGQYSQSGPVRVWDAAPIARGVGWSMFFLCLMIAYYYNMYAAYSIIYFSRCFNSILPWQDCDEPATSNYSCVPRMCVRSDTNHYTPAEHYFFHHILRIQPTSEILEHGLGPMVWTQVIAFLFAWILVYTAIIQSVRSIGKIVFFLVILPYFILLMLLTAGLMLEGSSRGLELLFSTDMKRLLDIQLWRVAAEEVFFELGICQGTPLAFGSYCHHRNPTHIDSAIICGINYFTSILCATVIFLILGALSMEIGGPVPDVLHHGPGIVFIVYPEALSRVPGSHIWCFMFFLMLFSVAIGTQIAIMETVMTVVYDEFDSSRPYRWLINLLICCCLFTLGITLCTSNGYLVVNLLDRMTGTMPRLPIAVCMVGTIVLIYGTGKYCEDIHFMIGYYPNIFLRFCLIITPFLLAALTIPSWIFKKPLKALGQTYSNDALNVAWFTIWFILIWIVLGAIYWCVYCYSVGQLKYLLRSLNSWGPRNFDARVARTEFSSENVTGFTKPWIKKSVRIEAGDT